MQAMKLLVFAGSTRQQSFNRRLARIAADLGRDANADVTLLELSGLDIPMYNADLEARGTPPDVIRLKEIMDIPVFHDDQHGTAVICAAGLINALEISGKKIEDCKIVLNGAGAAGIACL